MGLPLPKNRRNQFPKSLRSLPPRIRRSHFQKSRQSRPKTNQPCLQTHQLRHSKTNRLLIHHVQGWKNTEILYQKLQYPQEEFRWRTLVYHLWRNLVSLRSRNLQNHPPRNPQSPFQTIFQDPRMHQRNPLPKNRRSHFQTTRLYRRRCLGSKYWLLWQMQGCL